MFDKTLDEFFEGAIKRKLFSGAVCLISVDDKIIYKKSYGHRVIIQNNVSKKMKTDTIFDLASVTKMFTTTMILNLISKRKFQLETPLRDCIPRLNLSRRMDDFLSSTTIKQLLTHSSGIRAWFPFYSRRTDDFYHVLDDVLTVNSLKDGVVYSDINYMLLGEIIKYETNKCLHENIKDILGHPMNLQSTCYNPRRTSNIAATEFGNRIEMKMCRQRNIKFDDWRSQDIPMLGKVNDGNSYYYFNGISAHAGLFSQAIDVLKLGQLYLKGGEYKGISIIDQSLVNMSLLEQVPTRGLGWEKSDVFPEGCGHTGFTGTSLWIIPDRQAVVVTLTNRLHVKDPTTIQPFRMALHNKILKYI